MFCHIMLQHPSFHKCTLPITSDPVLPTFSPLPSSPSLACLYGRQFPSFGMWLYQCGGLRSHSAANVAGLSGLLWHESHTSSRSLESWVLRLASQLSQQAHVRVQFKQSIPASFLELMTKVCYFLKYVLIIYTRSMWMFICVYTMPLNDMNTLIIFYLRRPESEVDLKPIWNSVQKYLLQWENIWLIFAINSYSLHIPLKIK